MRVRYSDTFRKKKDWKDLELNQHLKKQIDKILKD
jgi:hypothetical protein